MRFPVRALAPALLVLSLVGGGCAKYEYNLVKPSELSKHVGSASDAVVSVDPLEYRLRTVDNRLVIRIFNPTDDVIELVGPRCSVVDPNGQSHPLRSQSIAPGSFIKLILPPPRPRVYDPYYGGGYWGPSVGVGVGYRTDAHPHGHYRHYGDHDPFWDPFWPDPGPQYLTVYDESDAFYWDWKDEGEARVVLTFRRGEKEFRHEFLFRRQKV